MNEFPCWKGKCGYPADGPFTPVIWSLERIHGIIAPGMKRVTAHQSPECEKKAAKRTEGTDGINGIL
jgi:hypothetical protein